MADIRIKDLTTTASSTASDDFIAVDGTTNGTRKLNAFSPTFGGNATVTGTLTANGLLTAAATTSLDGLPTAAIFGGTKRVVLGYNTSSDYGFIASADSGTTWKELHLNPSGGLVKVPSTSASTTTSSGALVVGDGTSGGLGVGGSITAGGVITSTNPGGIFQITGTGNTGASKELIFYRSDGGDTLNFGLTGSAYAGILTGLGNNEAYFYNSSSSAFRIFLGTAATQRYDFTANQFKINQTTASTSTSTGALVVSGGVGVAKSVTVGENIDIGTGHGTKLYVNNSGAWASKELLVTGYDTLDYTQIKVVGNASNTASIKLDQNGLATISGAVRTAAPSGGTAANWKLGTVATVSPTSPNRTIEVDIGGTIYYIHAKTTNN